ncbi:MAG: dimethyl sulfoxide reductase anchor subunit [Desulfitobacterium sp.]|nr:dimethyl sulfoxide reductase anchor subunit [Desulfitobacterium sp.]
MAELALLIFTICLQASIGIMVFVSIGKFVNKEGEYKNAILGAALLAVIGLLASLLHLGQPFSAINALSRFATSWLSREIWFTALFTGLTVLSALLALFKPDAKSAIKALVPIAGGIGLVDIFAMTAVYTSTGVPAWQHGSLFIEFYAATISMGALLFLALAKEESSSLLRIIVLTVFSAVLLQVVAMVLYYVGLGTSDNLAAQQSLALLGELNLATTLKWLFLLIGSGVLLFPQKPSPKVNVSVGKTSLKVSTTAKLSATTIYAATVLIIVGQIIGRYLFYVMMVTSQIGLS